MTGSHIRFWIGMGVLALVTLSGWWARRVARRSLGESLHRKLEQGEETSLRSWMEVPAEELEVTARRLERNPFDRILRWLGMGRGR